MTITARGVPVRFFLPVPVPVIYDPKTGGSGSGTGFFIRVNFQLFRFADGGGGSRRVYMAWRTHGGGISAALFGATRELRASRVGRVFCALLAAAYANGESKSAVTSRKM